MPNNIRLHYELQDDVSKPLDSLTAKAYRAAGAISGDMGKSLDTLNAKTQYTEAGLGRLGGFLEGNRSKFREVGSAGREFAAVAAVIGSDFGEAGSQVAAFGNVLSDTLLVGHAIADLGPRVVSAITGGGAAAEVAAGQYRALAVAEDAAAAGGAGGAGLAGLASGLAAVAVPLAVIAAVGGASVAVFAAGVQTVAALGDNSRKAAQAAGDLTGAQGALRAQFAAGAIDIDVYDAKLKNVRDQQYEQANAAAIAAGKTNQEADAFAKAAVEADMYAGKTQDLSQATINLTPKQAALAGQVGAVAAAVRALLDPYGTLIGLLQKGNEKTTMAGIAAGVASGYFRQFTTDAGETGKGLDNIGAKAIATAHGLDTTIGSVDDLKTSLDNLPHDINIDIRVRKILETTNADLGLGAGVSGAINPDFGDGVAGNKDTPSATGSLDLNPKPTKGRTGKSQAEKDAEAAAKALRDKLAAAYDYAYGIAKNAAAAAHDAALKGIQGEKDKAYAVAQTTYDLKLQGLEEQRVGLYAKVNADAAALNLARQGRNLRDLRESVDDAKQGLADAMAGGDPEQIKAAQRQLRNAREALADTQGQIAVDAEKATADAGSVQIDLKEKAAADELTAAQKHADNVYALEVENENKLYAQKQTAADEAYALLKGKLDDEKTLHSKYNTEILKLYDDSQAPARAAGAKVAASLLAGLKGKIAASVDLGSLKVTGTANDWKAAAAANLGPDVSASAPGATSIDRYTQAQDRFAAALERALANGIAVTFNAQQIGLLFDESLGARASVVTSGYTIDGRPSS